MVLGIDKGPRSEGYVRAAKRMKIPYQLIDTKANDVMEQIRLVDGFIWHFSHMNPWEMRIAKAVLTSAQHMGKSVYPDIHTCWMFDDKISEKYLLEAIGAPMVPTYVFFSEESCERWLRHTSYPLVYKLAGGAGSIHVCLVKNYSEGCELMHKHFSHVLKTEVSEFQRTWRTHRFHDIWETLGRAVEERADTRGEILFQEYLPNNSYDIRVTTIGKKNLIFNRLVRDHDFRASGSGRISYAPSERDIQAIKIARELSNKLQTQTMTYDFLYDTDGEFKICEISYGFAEYAIHHTPGWYDDNLDFHEEKTDVFAEVVEMVAEGIHDGK